MKLLRFLFILILTPILFGVLPTSPVQAETQVSPLNASGDFLWTKKMGGGSIDEGRAIALDSSGNVYTTGSFQSTVDFNPGAGTTNLTSISIGQDDIFVSKLDDSGNFVWAKRLGGVGNDIGYGTAVDLSGNVYITGSFEGTADFDPGAGTINMTSTGPNDIFVSKLDSNGNFVWARNMGGMSMEIGYGIAVDTIGNVYTIGGFSGTADFDSGAGIANLTSDGPIDIFVSKLDANGNFVWARNMGGAEGENGLGIAVDSNGNIYITGFFFLTADFDPGAGTASLTSAGSLDIFVSKLDSSGNFVWARSMGGTSEDAGFSITLDSSGNVYTTGGFSGTADFDPGAGTANLTSSGLVDIFVSKLDSSGNFVWAKGIGGTSTDAGLGITSDSSGNVYMTGYFSDIVDFDSGTGTLNLSSEGSLDIFVSKLSSSGDFIWAKGMGGTSTDKAYGIAIHSNESIYMVGSFSGTVDFDPGASIFNLVSAGDTDIFISKLDGDTVGPCLPMIEVINNQDAGSGSLRKAISDVCSEGTITFHSALSNQTIYLASTLVIDKNMTIDGSSLASQIQISGDTDNNGTGDVSVFQIDNLSEVELNGLDIVKGRAVGSTGGGGIANYGILTIRNSTVSGNSYVGGIGGGGIYNKGDLTLINSTISDNLAEDGGGIFNEYGHTLTITESTFSENTAQASNTLRGGGGAIVNLGTLSMEDSTFLDNYAVLGGGAIVNSINGTATVKDSSFTNNSTATKGGAINNFHGNVTIENSTFTDNSVIGNGYGGAVHNEDQMNIESSSFTENTSPHGGGIANLDTAVTVATLTIANSTIFDNSADYGGGIANHGILTMINSTVSGNSSPIGSLIGFGAGGGIVNDDEGILTITNSNIINNSASNGGGIFNLSTYGIVHISNSTLSGNSVLGNGGGISNFGTLDATNSTFFGNSAKYGGGIFNTTILTVKNSTFSGNSASTSGGGIGNFGTLNYANTIIANSTSGQDCYNNGSIVTNSNNLVENNSVSPDQCGTPSITADPNLAPLADNGGSTLTMSLLFGSPAIDAGDDVVCAAAPVNNNSQNGLSRPQGAHCDIGSFEAPDTNLPTILSITRANSNPNSLGSVNFLVTFSEPVTGVDASDFSMNTTGVVNATISNVIGSGATRTVKVNTGSGDGTIRLNAIDNDTIMDFASNPLNGGFSSGEVYTIDKPNLPAPVLRSPRSGVLTNDTTPTFWWTNVKGGQSYEIQFATDNSFVSIVYSETINGSSHTVVSPFSDGLYYWRVRGYNTSNQPGGWSSSRRFTIDTLGPAAPVLNSPANHVTTRRPIFRWSRVSTAIEYQIQYDNDEDFSSPTYTFRTRSTFRKPPVMGSGTYYWRVQAKDALGNWGAWSLPFTIIIPAP